MQTDPGIYTIDTGFQRPGFDAAYLVVENGRGAFIDCATNHCLPRLMQTLHEAGLAPEDVDWLILTHVHLDHAGGAGELLAKLPNAQLLVHPRGARHMIDPSKLWAGAMAVYGEEEMLRSYGELKPIPAERVVEAPDEYAVELAGRRLRILATPGHAKHHNAIVDEQSGHIFGGDTFGLSYREFDSDRGAFVIPTSAPGDFDPEALHNSVQRVADLRPPAIHLTHFAAVTEIQRLAGDMHRGIDDMVAIARRHADGENRHAALAESLQQYYGQRVTEHGAAVSMEQCRALLAMDCELNAQGLGVWLDRQPASA